MGNINIEINGDEVSIEQAIAIAFEAGNVCFADIMLEAIDEATKFPDTVLTALRDEVEDMRRVILEDIGTIQQSAQEAVRQISEDVSTK